MRSVLPIITAVQAHVLTLAARSSAVDLDAAPRAVPGRARSDAGQTTAEYALVLLGAAAIALLLAAWAAKSGKIGQLFDAVVDQLIGEVG